MNLLFKILLVVLGLSSASAAYTRYYVVPSGKEALNQVNQKQALDSYILCKVESNFYNHYNAMRSCNNLFNKQLAKIDISTDPNKIISYQSIGKLYKQVQRKKQRQRDTPLNPLHQLVEQSKAKKILGFSL